MMKTLCRWLPATGRCKLNVIIRYTMNRLFDAVRGMEYVIDLRDANHRLHRVRALRPLTRAEAINEVKWCNNDI